MDIPQLSQISEYIQTVVKGRNKEIELLIIAMLSNTHVLMEGPPGTGKTLLVHTIADSLGLNVKYTAFTPDMLPSDITGVTLYNQKTLGFEFRPGPLFTNIFIGDDLNRASPKTQSGLLQAMEQRAVTIDGIQRNLPIPFLVFATQNSMEDDGTFPLPFAQLDRFGLKLYVDYLDDVGELSVLMGEVGQKESIQPLLHREDILALQASTAKTHVDEEVARYIVSIIQATRTHPDVYLGASTRASIQLYRIAQAVATLRQRNFVIPDDVKYIASTCLCHRILLTPSSRIKNVTPQQIIEDIFRHLSMSRTHVAKNKI